MKNNLKNEMRKKDKFIIDLYISEIIQIEVEHPL